MLRVILFAWLVLGVGILGAQEGANPANEDDPRDAKNLERLRTLIPALDSAQEELESHLESLSNTQIEAEREQWLQAVDLQRERLAELRDNFRTLASGVEEERYLGIDEEENTLEKNVEDIIEPLSRTVRDLTAAPREMENLREEVRRWEERLQLGENAILRLDGLLGLAENPTAVSELEGARKFWQARVDATQSELEVLKQQLETREATEQSAWQKVSAAFAQFWRSRGLNLLIAIVAGVLTYWVAKRCYRIVRRHSPIHHRKTERLTARLLDLAAAIISILLALFAIVGAFYLRGDWLLMTLSILLILGVGWASKHTLPQFIEQFRVVLNLGAVRLGERVVYNDIAWRVDRLNFYSELRNPVLRGGLLRLPVKDVIELRSRPYEEHEPWFPTKENDWVVLGDGTFGKVVQQTPEQIIVLQLGGSRKTYSVSNFLDQAPENLSHGFRISSTFGIDYSHQPVATSEVPESFRHALEEKLVSVLDRDQVHAVRVELSSAAASSIDYTILTDFGGAAAPRMNVLQRMVQACCVDVCNERGWIIPFTQLTVHQAEVESPPEVIKSSGDENEIDEPSE